MRLLRVATWLVALIFSVASLGWAAEVTYSGIPGKWRRGTKGAKAAAPEAKTRPKDKGAKKIIDNDKLKVTVGPKTGVKSEKMTRSRALLSEAPQPLRGLSGIFLPAAE